MSATRSERSRRSSRRARPAARLAAAVATATAPALAAAALAAAPLRAQEPEGALARLGLDRLRLTGVGATAGVVRPAQIVGAQTVGVHADYGEITRGWRAVFGVTYWGSRYRDGVVRRLADSVLAAVDDPTGDATADLGRVRVSVVALTADARWSPRRRRPSWIRPYVGGSIGGYAMNAEGRVISGTFLEDALDNISAGVAAVGGADVGVAPNITLGVHGRYDLLSGARFASLRAGLTYIFRSREGT